MQTYIVADDANIVAHYLLQLFKALGNQDHLLWLVGAKSIPVRHFVFKCYAVNIFSHSLCTPVCKYKRLQQGIGCQPVCTMQSCAGTFTAGI